MAVRPVYLHRRHQAGIMRRLSRNPILNDQDLPNRIDSRRIGQEVEHAFDPGQFHGNCGRRHAHPVLLNRPSGDHPEFHKVLGNDVRVSPPAWQGFQGTRNGFILRMANL